MSVVYGNDGKVKSIVGQSGSEVGFTLTENHAAEHAAMGIGFQIEAKDAASSTVYVFRNPVTQASNLISDERSIFVPTDVAGVYFGAMIGKRIKAHTAESITDIGLFRAGLHTWHGSLTKVGTWVTSPAGVSTGAFQATGCPYSLTAGDTISGTVTGTVAAIRLFMSTPGGYGIVAIDGDWTLANKLPTFTSADYDAGFCRQSDVGKRYYSSYCAAPTNECICLAADLLPGTHTITIEATGTKPSAATAARAYVEAFIGCNGETLGAANVYAVPIYWQYHDLLNWSAFDYVVYWAPSGSTDYQFMGNIHGDNTQSKEVTTSLSVTVNVADQTSLAQGSWASGQVVRIDHVSTLAHKANTATVVATKTRRYTFAPSRRHPMMIDEKIEWSADGVVNIEYPAMLPIGEVVTYSTGMKQDLFTSANIGTKTVSIPSTHDNAMTYVTTDTRRLIASGPKLQTWAEVVAEIPDSGWMYASSGGSMQDRSTKDKKLYSISAFGPQPVTSGDVKRFILGFGARLV